MKDDGENLGNKVKNTLVTFNELPADFERCSFQNITYIKTSEQQKFLLLETNRKTVTLSPDALSHHVYNCQVGSCDCVNARMWPNIYIKILNSQEYIHFGNPQKNKLCRR